MKILFLQNCIDSIGGAERVNQILSNEFSKDGHEVSIVYMWDTNKNEIKIKDNKIKKIRISNHLYMDKPSGRKIINDFTKLRIFRSIKDLYIRLTFNRRLQNDLKKGNKICQKIDSDIIIVSNEDLLNCVPRDMLNKTICHLHSGFIYYENNKKATDLIKTYSSDLAKVVWLTKSSVIDSVKLGIDNSTHINNPKTFTSKEKADVSNNKNMIYIGRYAPEKRLDLLLLAFDEFNKTNKDWNLFLYGSGNLSKEAISIIENNKNIKNKGVTKNPRAALLKSSLLALTSRYEGLPMVIKEAYECGVPVIAFNYGKSIYEIITNNENGIIVENDNLEEYIQKLNEYAHNKEYRKRLSNGAKKYAKQDNISNIKKEWYKLFKEVLNEKS